MDRQLHRYFVGIVGFGFVACWSADGFLTASLALATCTGLVMAPRLITNMGREPRRTSRRSRISTVRARPLHQEEQDSLPLVPDEPSLILELRAQG